RACPPKTIPPSRIASDTDSIRFSHQSLSHWPFCHQSRIVPIRARPPRPPRDRRSSVPLAADRAVRVARRSRAKTRDPEMRVDRGVSATEGWMEPARRALVGLRGGGRAWSYRAGAEPSVEPTALACLGLLASRRGAAAGNDLAAIQAAADWLAALQNPDGSL